MSQNDTPKKRTRALRLSMVVTASAFSLGGCAEKPATDPSTMHANPPGDEAHHKNPPGMPEHTEAHKNPPAPPASSAMPPGNPPPPPMK